MAYQIYLSPPSMGGKEFAYVKEAFDTNWIAPAGPHINAFEQEMASYIGVQSAVALASGTAAIHLALRWLGVEQDDLVFCSDFTFIGSCAAVLYQKATPVFIDSEPETWNMSPGALEKAFAWARQQGKMPKAVIIVDLYGESADWDALLPICRKYNVPVIEDAAEAVGSCYKGRMCGSFGDISVLSFNGNKIVTTSGGGMALSNNKQAMQKMRFWSTQAREPEIHYEHVEYGYNYRMSNVCAAIGRGQLDYLPEKMKKRKWIHGEYSKRLSDLPMHIKQISAACLSNHWLSVLVTGDAATAAKITQTLQAMEIETRPAWKPMHMQPIFSQSPFFAHAEGGSVGESIFKRSLCLPSGDSLSEEQLITVVQGVRSCV